MRRRRMGEARNASLPFLSPVLRHKRLNISILKVLLSRGSQTEEEKIIRPRRREKPIKVPSFFSILRGRDRGKGRERERRVEGKEKERV
jgi:hypothetical protein